MLYGLALSQCGRACPTVERNRVFRRRLGRRQNPVAPNGVPSNYFATVTQGCGRGGLTLGYIHASPTGTKNGTSDSSVNSQNRLRERAVSMQKPAR